MELGDREFSRLAGLLRETTGINLTEKKRTLVRGRLSSLFRSEGISGFEEYLRLLEADASGARLLDLVDRISTNHSYLYREPEHLHDLVDRALPQLIAAERSSGEAATASELRIWCAAAAAGEEPYTIAMLLHAAADRLEGRIPRILATDISVSALAGAERGIYGADRVRHLPQQLRERYLTVQEDGRYAVRDEIRAMVTFRRLNLMRSEYPFRMLFHAVFLRNVMIYFDEATKEQLVDRIAGYLLPGAALYTGRAESIARPGNLLRSLGQSRYERRGGRP